MQTPPKTPPTRIALIGLFLIFALTISTRTPRTVAEEPSRETNESSTTINVVVTSVLVNDQEKALNFYTKKLGFVKKADIPMGGPRWLTVVSPDQPDGPEVLLEPWEPMQPLAPLASRHLNRVTLQPRPGLFENKSGARKSRIRFFSILPFELLLL